MEQRVYDVLVMSLHHRMHRNVTRWERGVRAASLTEACRIAEQRHPNLGITPTATSMAWYVWPQPKSTGAQP